MTFLAGGADSKGITEWNLNNLLLTASRYITELARNEVTWSHTVVLENTNQCCFTRKCTMDASVQLNSELVWAGL